MKTAAAVALMVLVSAGAFANERQEKLLALSEADRNAALAGFVRDNGFACAEVARSMAMGTDYKGRAAWSVECRDKDSYALNIDIDTKFRPFAATCEDAKAFAMLVAAAARSVGEPLKSPAAECWQKF